MGPLDGHSRCQWSPQTWSPDVYKISDPGVREGVPHKPLPHTAEKSRNGTCVMPHRTTNKNMVPKSKDETKEGNSSNQRIKRTRKSSPSLQNGSSSTTTATATSSGGGSGS